MFGKILQGGLVFGGWEGSRVAGVEMEAKVEEKLEVRATPGPEKEVVIVIIRTAVIITMPNRRSRHGGRSFLWEAKCSLGQVDKMKLY
jgi:hypothetical protein